MLTASNKKHARLKMNECIYISSRMAWVFSKSKVILFTTQQLAFIVAFVTFGDVIKYQTLHKNLHVRKMPAKQFSHMICYMEFLWAKMKEE